jgi:hypothetical protein
MLASARTSAATLLYNLAACHLHLGAPVFALSFATAATLLAPTDPKARHRQASALLQLGWLASATAAVAAGLEQLPIKPCDDGGDDKEVAALEALQGRIDAASKTAGAAAAAVNAARAGTGWGGEGGAQPAGGSTSGSGGGGGKKPGKPPTERQQRDSAPPAMEASELAASSALLSAMLSDPKFAERLKGMGMPSLVDSRVAPFHTEFSQAGRLPVGCDVPSVQKFLHGAYEHARIQNQVGGICRLGSEVGREVGSKVGRAPHPYIAVYCQAPIARVDKPCPTVFK